MAVVVFLNSFSFPKIFIKIYFNNVIFGKLKQKFFEYSHKYSWTNCKIS